MIPKSGSSPVGGLSSIVDLFGEEVVGDAGTCDLPEEILRFLSSEEMIQWRRIRDRGLVSEIVAFAQRIKGIGEKCTCRYLTEYGSILEEQTVQFQPDSFEAVLLLFPRLIELLKR